MFCRKCRTQLPDDALVCSNCGEKTNVSGAIEPNANAANTNVSSGNGNGNKNIIIGVIVAAIVACCAFFYVSYNSSFVPDFVSKDLKFSWDDDLDSISKRYPKWTFKKEKTISDIQYQIILFGTLGDGHIDKREDQPIYIESHAIDEKDYCFWKYEQLKDLCNSPPKYYPATYNTFGSDKKYYCLPYYRFETRIINQLKEIRSMKRMNKIEQLNILGLVLHVLDDGNRGDLWNLCLAEYTQEEIDTYILHLQDILNFANIVNNAPVEGLSEIIGANENYNVFRKDEIKVFVGKYYSVCRNRCVYLFG